MISSIGFWGLYLTSFEVVIPSQMPVEKSVIQVEEIFKLRIFLIESNAKFTVMFLMNPK